MFDVYNLLDIEPVKAEKAYFWDRQIFEVPSEKSLGREGQQQ